MNAQLVTNAALQLTKTPFARGFNAVFFNNSGAAATLQGSDDGVTYTNLAAATAAGSMTNVVLPAYVKLAAAGAQCYLLASN